MSPSKILLTLASIFVMYFIEALLLTKRSLLITPSNQPKFNLSDSVDYAL